MSIISHKRKNSFLTSRRAGRCAFGASFSPDNAGFTAACGICGSDGKLDMDAKPFLMRGYLDFAA